MAYRHRDGRWLAVWHDETGRRRTRTFESRRTAEVYERSQRRNRDLVEAGLTTWQRLREQAHAQRSVDAVIDLVCRDLELRRRTPAYQREFRRLARAALDSQLERPIAEVDPGGVLDLVARLRQGSGTARNRNAYVAAAKQITGYAVRQGWLDRDPLMALRLEPLPLGGERLRKSCIDPAVFRSLIDDRVVRESGRRTWYMVRFLSGLRGSECSRLRRADLRAAGEIVYIDLPAESAKTGQPRRVPLVPDVAAELLQERGWLEPDQLLWTRPPAPKTWMRDIERIGADRRIRPSWIRLTLDVWMDEVGISALDQQLITGRTGRGSSAISTWTYQDLSVALPRLDRALRRVWEYVQRDDALRSAAPAQRAGFAGEYQP